MLPSILTPDVMVAGGGTAGCAAAIAAARRGHRVLLVEETNCLGGTSTSGGVNEWYASLDGLGDIFDQVQARLARFSARHGNFFNGEYLKIVWQLMAQEAGVQILFHASACEAEIAGGTVHAVGLRACSQPLTVTPRFVIDATGEGDLAAAAGAAFMQGHPETGRTLHMTLTFSLTDTGRPISPYLPDGLQEIRDTSELPGLHGGRLLPDGRVYCNMTKVMDADPTNPLDLSRAEAEARLQLVRIVHYLQRTRFPTYALCSSGAHIGTREGRRIIGDTILTEADILTEGGKDFADGVAVATSAIDFHSLTRPGDGGWRQAVAPYAIPLRCLIARDFRNLLMAGKCISGDQVALSSYRMTPTCCAMGQAAGAAVALALEARVNDIRQVDIDLLRDELTRTGMQLDPKRHTAYAPASSADPARGA